MNKNYRILATILLPSIIIAAMASYNYVFLPKESDEPISFDFSSTQEKLQYFAQQQLEIPESYRIGNFSIFDNGSKGTTSITLFYYGENQDGTEQLYCIKALYKITGEEISAPEVCENLPN